jgi:tetratricopeptide (TPR) repeat protein
MRKMLLAATAAALFAIAPSASQAAVTVIGGGLAEACSNAAIAGESNERFQDLCSMALDTEMLNARDRAGTFVNRGVMKMRQKQWSRAERDFDAAVRLKDDLGEAYVNRGAVYIGQSRFADGLVEINRGLQLGIDEPAKGYYNRALAHEGLDDVKSAYFDYQKAVQLDPEWQAPKQQLVRFTVSRRSVD